MFILICYLLLVSLQILQCDSLESGWKGLKPLVANKEAAEKILGKAKVDDNNYHMYTTDEAYVEVNYSSQPCKENQYGRGVFNLPENTILDYSIILKNGPQYSDLDIKREKYKWLGDGDVLSQGSYVNAEDGIRIHIRIERDGIQVVEKIYFTAVKADAARFLCK